MCSLQFAASKPVGMEYCVCCVYIPQYNFTGTLSCSRPRTSLLPISELYVVRFNSQPCDTDFDHRYYTRSVYNIYALTIGRAHHSVRIVAGEMKRHQLHVEQQTQCIYGIGGKFCEYSNSIVIVWAVPTTPTVYDIPCMRICVVYNHITLSRLYLQVNSSLSGVGYSYVNCSGREEGLEECTIGNLTSHNCSHVALILKCLDGNIYIYM